MLKKDIERIMKFKEHTEKTGNNIHRIFKNICIFVWSKIMLISIGILIGVISLFAGLSGEND